jgi:hypothetical protein
VRREGHHRRRAFRIGGGEQQRQPPTQVAAEEGRPPGANRVKDHADVVQLVLEGLPGRAAVGQAVAEPVHQDEP